MRTRHLTTDFACTARICVIWLAFISMIFRPCSVTAQSSNQNESPNKSTAVKPASAPLSGSTRQEETNFDEQKAFGFLEQVCEIGPRISGSEGMKKQQTMLQEHFEAISGAVYYQNFIIKHPQTGQEVELKNQLVRWHPEREKRLLVCCHYDTRPFPDRDPVNPRGVFIGANDGGSGVALLCELGNHVETMEGEFGVDFVFFDGEEFVFVNRRDDMFLGSTHFAREYAARRIRAKYVAGVLVDMVADKNLQIHYEGNSLKRAPRVTRDLWAIAGKLGIDEFVPKRRHNIRDDHLPLNQIARIPVCDIIDFDFPVEGNNYWHTEKDVIENCSAESLGKVGTVVLAWLREMQTRR